jgi:phage shock protein C
MPLHRARQDRILGGVCGGIAHWLGWDPTLVRVLYVLISLFSAAFPGTLVYIILWIFMPLSQEY